MAQVSEIMGPIDRSEAYKSINYEFYLILGANVHATSTERGE
jgi:hypothetical protein